MLLETKLTARFVPENATEMTAQKQESMKALNHHAEAVADSLQAALRLLVIEMLNIKREQFAIGDTDERLEQPDISPND